MSKRANTKGNQYEWEYKRNIRYEWEPKGKSSVSENTKDIQCEWKDNGRSNMNGNTKNYRIRIMLFWVMFAVISLVIPFIVDPMGNSVG